MSIKRFDWQWNVPEDINIGHLCSSIHLGSDVENKLAMIVENDELGTSQITFKELAKKTDQFAQCLLNFGLEFSTAHCLVFLRYLAAPVFSNPTMPHNHFYKNHLKLNPAQAILFCSYNV